MQTARRLYVYLLSGITLGVLVTGVGMLLEVLFDAIGFGRDAGVIFGGGSMRERLPIAAALVVVGLPVWLAHWIAAERTVAVGAPQADAERSSIVRGLYFLIAMTALLIPTAFGLRSLIEELVLSAAGASEFNFTNPAADLAIVIAAGSAWAYHVALRARDWGRGPIQGAGAFLPRTYLYLATFVGLIVMLSGIYGLVDLVGRVILDAPQFGLLGGDLLGGEWWASPLASAISMVVVGGATWFGHWIFAGRLLRDPGWRGASERPARVRLAYYVAAIVVTAAVAIGMLSSAASAALQAAFGVSQSITGAELTGLIILPLFGALIFGPACLVHRRWLAEESISLGVAGRVTTAGRLDEYGTTLAGLAFAGWGVAAILGVLLNSVLSSGRTLGGGEFLLRELSEAIPPAVFGGALWIWSWRRATARHAAAPLEEAGSTTRRAALLLVVAVSLLTGIGSLGYILYRLFGEAMGISGGGELSDLSRPIGVLAVAIVVGLYHASLLQRDQRLRASVEAETPGTAGDVLVTPGSAAGTPAAIVPPVAAATVPPAATGSVVLLRLVGPAGGDLTAVAASLRANLPAGYAIESVTPEPRG